MRAEATRSASGVQAVAIPQSAPERLDPVALRRALWIARLYYFGFYGALGSIIPFFNVYLQERGLSGPQIGLMASVPPLIALAANPVWGAIADRWQAYRQVLVICALGAGLSSLAFIWVDQFVSILIFLCMLNFFRTPISAILDGTVMGLIAVHPEVDYARQRVFGSFGWIALSLTVGYLAGQVHIYTIFVLHTFFLAALCALLSLRLPVQRTGNSVNYSEGLRTLLRLPAYRTLLIYLVLFGAGSACISNFLGLNILRLGGTAALIGYTNASAAILEVPMMFQGHRWSRRFNRRDTLVIAMVGFALLWALIGASTSPWMVPVFVAAYGIFFALLWVAFVGFANALAPDGLRASAQAIAQSGHSGLGWAMGSLLSGFLWAWYPPAVFYGAAIMAAAGALILGLGTRGKGAVGG